MPSDSLTITCPPGSCTSRAPRWSPSSRPTPGRMDTALLSPVGSVSPRPRQPGNHQPTRLTTAPRKPLFARSVDHRDAGHRQFRLRLGDRDTAALKDPLRSEAGLPGSSGRSGGPTAAVATCRVGKGSLTIEGVRFSSPTSGSGRSLSRRDLVMRRPDPLVVQHAKEATMPTPAERRELLRQLDELTDDVWWRASEVQGRTSARSAPRALSWSRGAGNVREGR